MKKDVCPAIRHAQSALPLTNDACSFFFVIRLPRSFIGRYCITQPGAFSQNLQELFCCGVEKEENLPGLLQRCRRSHFLTRGGDPLLFSASITHPPVRVIRVGACKRRLGAFVRRARAAASRGTLLFASLLAAVVALFAEGGKRRKRRKVFCLLRSIAEK